jgi:hypothetical protein
LDLVITPACGFAARSSLMRSRPVAVAVAVAVLVPELEARARALSPQSPSPSAPDPKPQCAMRNAIVIVVSGPFGLLGQAVNCTTKGAMTCYFWSTNRCGGWRAHHSTLVHCTPSERPGPPVAPRMRRCAPLLWSVGVKAPSSPPGPAGGGWLWLDARPECIGILVFGSSGPDRWP